MPCQLDLRSSPLPKAVLSSYSPRLHGCLSYTPTSNEARRLSRQRGWISAFDAAYGRASAPDALRCIASWATSLETGLSQYRRETDAFTAQNDRPSGPP